MTGPGNAAAAGSSRSRPRWLLPITLAWIVLLALLAVGPAIRVEPLLNLELVTDALDDPVAIAGHPSDPSRLLVVERAGKVVVVEDGAVRPEPLLDLASEVESEALEQGLLGIVFDPAFAQNGRLFLYETDRASRMLLFSVGVSPDLSVADPSSRRDILAIPDPDPFHNGGQLAFGPDGKLYIGIGDGGLLQGGWRDGRDPASLLGKILRLDVDGEPDPGLAYAIPKDNPFVSVAGARGELWAIGLRNPWRFAFDREGGNLWLADVGQLKWEEVNSLPWEQAAGANFGWNLMEGNVCFQAATCDRTGLVLPIAVYPHRDGNCAVIGGFVYRGPGGRLNGQYLMGDYCSGRIWTIGPGEREMVLQQDTDLTITTFGQSADGTAYVASQDGRLLRVVAAR
jgi:glucose/arabinose dehydrogenase